MNVCLWYECKDSLCKHCGSVWWLYSVSIESKLTISVDRLRAVGSADVVAGAVCHIQPERRDRARAGNNLLAGERWGRLFSQGASAWWWTFPLNGHLLLFTWKKENKNQHTEWNAGEIHSTREAFIHVCEKQTKTDKDWHGELRRMDVGQLRSLRQMWWLVREPVRWFGSLETIRYTWGLDSSSRISERQNQPSNAPTHNPSHGDFGTCRHAVVLISRWCVLSPQEQIKVGRWAL